MIEYLHGSRRIIFAPQRRWSPAFGIGSGLLEANNLAHMGRPGLVPGTRELIEFPYIIVYSVDDDRREVSVVAIVHGAQDRGRE